MHTYIHVLHAYIYVHVYMYMYMYCMHIHVHTCIHVHVYMCTHTHLFCVRMMVKTAWERELTAFMLVDATVLVDK